MLIPAILRADEIKSEMMKSYYSDDMMYWAGTIENYLPKISEEPDASRCEFAIVDSGGRLLGFMGYTVDWYSGCAYNFGIFSFDQGNITVGRDILGELNRLISEYKMHRIEWRMIGGNHVERSYDRFCKKYNGRKHVLKDVFKDRCGNYHDDVIYEIFPNRNI